MAEAQEQRVKMRLTVGIEEAAQAVLDGLPEDAIVRGYDDGVGRYAGERVLVVVGRGKKKLQLFRGTYGGLKRRLDKGMLEVDFEEDDRGRVVAHLTQEPPATKSVVSHAMGLVLNIATIALVVFAYHNIRGLEMDNERTALVSVLGGVVWSAFGWFGPKRKDDGLLGVAKSALKPHKRKKAKPAKADAEDEGDAEAQVEDDADAAAENDSDGDDAKS